MLSVKVKPAPKVALIVSSRFLKTISHVNSFTEISTHYKTSPKMNIITSKRLVMKQFGTPSEVVTLENATIPYPEKNELLLEMLMAPINPVDVNLIQGRYWFNLPLPAVLGVEGVARVVQTGPDVHTLKVGDHVFPWGHRGTWTKHLIMPEDMLLKIPTEVSLIEASMLKINPLTVYRMLKDFVSLKQGDTVIQNGANSACGQFAIQMCHSWGINTVNIVRDRPEIAELKSHLKTLGATFVLTEEETKTTDLFSSGKLAKPTLALNCVGGDSAVNLIKLLENAGTMVTYGGMSKKMITVTTSNLVFKEVKLVGFNANRWTYKKENFEERSRMYDELFAMIMRGELKAPPCTLVKLDDVVDVLENIITDEGKTGNKYVIDFS